MSARIIDGQAIARQIKDELLPRIAALKAQGVVPGLAAVLIGDNPASQAYVNMKTKAFAALGLYSETFFLPKTTTMPEVLHLIDNLNHNPQFHGILVQLRIEC